MITGLWTVLVVAIALYLLVIVPITIGLCHAGKSEQD